MARRKEARPELTLGGPRTSSALELAYCILREAEDQEPGEAGRFKAMDLHTWLIDLSADHSTVQDAMFTLGLAPRIYANQVRLGIV